MSPLNEQQKQLIFDYCIGVTSEQEATLAHELIFSNHHAAEFHSMLKTILNPLETVRTEQCPKELTERTVAGLKNLANSSQLRLQHLLAAEQIKDTAVRPRFWRNISEILAAAAAIVFIAGVLMAPLNLARQKYWQYRCQTQLSNISQGLSNYSADNEGRLPAVAIANDSPWWKVGYQGNENHSNTRNMWLLVKNNYANPDNFVCISRKTDTPARFDTSQIKNYSDFPSRSNVTYSFRITRNPSQHECASGEKILISDLNPLFENLPQDYSNPFRLQPTERSLTINSINHNCGGQNVLFGNGGIRFIKMRNLDDSSDDIFTIQNTSIYKGCEIPSADSDAFLAP